MPGDGLGECCFIERHRRIATMVMAARHMLDRHAGECRGKARALRHLPVESDEDHRDRAAMAFHHRIGRQRRRYAATSRMRRAAPLPAP